MAWEKIVQRYHGLVWATVRSFRLQHADACDAVQMTWLKLVEKCDSVENPERLGGWLMTTARRECLHIADRINQMANSGEEVADFADPAVRIEDWVVDAADAHSVRALVGELPPRWRSLIYALYIDIPRSYSEISDILEIPIGSIGPTRTRALLQLRHLVEERGL